MTDKFATEIFTEENIRNEEINGRPITGIDGQTFITWKTFITWMKNYQTTIPERDDFLEQVVCVFDYEKYFKNSATVNDIRSVHDGIRMYLDLKLFDHVPLNAAEIILVRDFPELDKGRIVYYPVDSENTALIEKAARLFSSDGFFPESEDLTDEEQQSLAVVLEDYLIDGEPFTQAMRQALEYVRGESVTDIDQHVLGISHQGEKVLAEMEYGYNIYDLDAVHARISRAHETGISISRRETRIIQRQHGFDPNGVGF